MLQEKTIEDFETSLLGELIHRNNGKYEEKRLLYNGMIDKRPFLIAQCTDVADVISAVQFGRENNLTTAIRGGGHNGPGLGSCDDGLVIDLSEMKGIRVDPEKRVVRAEPGCTTGELDHACHGFGLAVPTGIVSTTGISGLTLGGGHGYLSRKYGLTIDNLIEADVVLADGSFVTASENQNKDLFWALRGGGGNFGVVTSFVFQAHPVRMVYGGPIFWPVDDARQIMKFYREFLPQAPVDFSPFFGLKTVPSTEPFPEKLWGEKICALISCYDGPEEEAEAVMKPIRDELPEPVLDWMQMMPFTALQGLFDPLLPKGLQWYWKGDFVKDLPDEAIEIHLEYAAKAPSELSLMHLYPIDGAVHNVKPNETAWNCRDAAWSMVIAGIDPDPSNADDLTSWGKEYWEAVHPYNMSGAYVNFMMEEGENRIMATYGDNYDRLKTIKKKYDPDNFFCVNQNIKP
ncbi:MAG: FAD-binding oxidoreductase [Balneolaceae bacterium]